jgi:hypothetical protein
MNAITKEARMTGVREASEREPVSEATRLAQYNILNEMPVAIFGAMTIFFIVSSLMSLAH